MKDSDPFYYCSKCGLGLNPREYRKVALRGSHLTKDRQESCRGEFKLVDRAYVQGPLGEKGPMEKREKETDDIAGYLVDVGDGEQVNPDFNETVLNYLDGLWDHPLPRKIVVVSYRRSIVEIGKSSVLEGLLEQLEEEYGDPEGEWDQYPDDFKKMEEAEKVFLDRICELYHSWSCKEIPGSGVEVDVENWIKEHAPGWLTEGKGVRFGEDATP